MPLCPYQPNQMTSSNHQSFQSHLYILFSLTQVSLSKNHMTTSSKIVGMIILLPLPQKIRRLIRSSSLPTSWFKIHDGPQRGVPKGCHTLISIIWIPYHSQTQCPLLKIDFTVPLPDFKQNWTTIIGDDILFSCHSIASSLLKSETTSTNASSLNYVSAKHLLSPCPLSIFKALDYSNPGRQICIGLYEE